MTRLLAIAAFLIMLLVNTNASDARGGSYGSRSSSYHGSHGSYSHGHGFNHSYPFSHNRWSSRYWNSQYGCYFNYSNFDSCYYYFYAPSNCYYPVSCITQYRTASSAPSVQVVNQNVNQNTLINGSPGVVPVSLPPAGVVPVGLAGGAPPVSPPSGAQQIGVRMPPVP